ncbi:hypothetical protein X975_24121, partial [Stegodyphus mimosarum]
SFSFRFYTERAVVTVGGLYAKRKRNNLDASLVKLIEEETTPKDEVHHFMMYGACVSELLMLRKEKKKTAMED